VTAKNLEKLIEYWKQGAKDDMSAAQDIALKAKRYMQSLFFLHLSIEKSLKALVVFHSKDHAPLSHNLVFLAQKAGLELTETQTRLLNQINEYNISTRYPDEAGNLYKKATATYTKKILKEGKEIKKWIFTKFNN